MPRAGAETTEPEELQRCIRDLMALSALPAIKDGSLPGQITETMSAALVPMLDAELVFISVAMPGHAYALEHASTRLGPASGMTVGLRKSLAGWLPGSAQRAASPISNPLGGGQLHIASARVGYGGEGVTIAGSLDPAFPTPHQRLLLNIAADETAIGLHRWDSERGQHRFAALVENSSDFIGFADLEGSPIYLNPAGLRMVGLQSLEQMAGLNISDFVAEADRTRLERELWPNFFRQGRWTGELRLRNFTGGSDVPVRVDWFYIFDPRSRKPLNIATVSSDLRVQKAREGELRSLNASLEGRIAERTAELEAVNMALRQEMRERELANSRLRITQSDLFHASRLSAAGQMAATLAHEMSQPLAAATNAVNAAVRLLSTERPGSLDFSRDALDEAAQQLDRANQIIRQLRSFVGRGKAERRMESIREIVDEAISFTMLIADAVGVEVTLDLDPEASLAHIDRIQIQQVLVNLLRNSLEAMSGCEARWLMIRSVLLESGKVEISVADRGEGISLEEAERLFEPFFTTKDQGTGLGLSICRSIVEAHGGTLRCEPNPDGGMIFAFTLEATEGA